MNWRDSFQLCLHALSTLDFWVKLSLILDGSFSVVRLIEITILPNGQHLGRGRQLSEMQTWARYYE